MKKYVKLTMEITVPESFMEEEGVTLEELQSQMSNIREELGNFPEDGEVFGKVEMIEK